LNDCAIVVRSKYCSHSLYHAAKARAMTGAIWIEEKAPNAVNTLLLEICTTPE
jgi:hypothetical protein